ncbi:Flavin monooxygenase-like protein [Cordyceps fumosorosea ARSEF 2679]|uniref:Flavin monooxygenase-like protein n=1 Tax=Cordyceps fumosorosea (strain ARSEF 2679) TaxID=1081104 RepID=A0A166ZQN0_CORFA|nr:Flavin monooxygenase-like protein [Cordyceps fumosorosea ARSEF 2679]OAA38154.1 Flavin monooxygenase-like protein [Cordyceps fumosorosea ARSEF 2679]
MALAASPVAACLAGSRVGEDGPLRFASALGQYASTCLGVTLPTIQYQLILQFTLPTYTQIIKQASTNSSSVTIDALIVGGGFAGIGQAYALRNLGLSIKLIDSLHDVGGTWRSNIYPGATSDPESFVYRLFWDKEDLQSYPWTRRYLRQPEILAYLEHFVEKHGLRKQMQFNTELLSAAWDDDAATWEIKTNTGETYSAPYFISAMGDLSKAHRPSIPGASSFGGVLVHSSHWPDTLNVTDKRVGVVGCGASGVQIMTTIAPKVLSLTGFFRHPQYVVPSNDREVTVKHREWVNENYDVIWDQDQNSFMGFGFTESPIPFFSVDPTRREQLLQDSWSNGNRMRFLAEHFCDIGTNREANEEVCRFICDKIRRTVKDPKKAQKLIPNELFARRPICMDGYYEMHNRDNVEVVDLRRTPIAEITPVGIRTDDGTVYELDVIILATGFDAIDGNLMKADIRSRGRLLRDSWADGPRSYIGAFAAGFPNMFMVNGLLGAVANVVPAIEASIEVITNAIEQAEAVRKSRAPTPLWKLQSKPKMSGSKSAERQPKGIL